MISSSEFKEISSGNAGIYQYLETGTTRDKLHWLEILKLSSDQAIENLTSKTTRETWITESGLSPRIVTNFLDIATITTQAINQNVLYQKSAMLFGPTHPPKSVQVEFKHRSLLISEAIEESLQANQVEQSEDRLSLHHISNALRAYICSKNHDERKKTFSHFQKVERKQIDSPFQIHISSQDTVNPYVKSGFTDEDIGEILFGIITPEIKKLAPLKELVRSTLREKSNSIDNTNGRIIEIILQMLVSSAGYGIVSRAQGISSDRVAIVNINQVRKRFEEQSKIWLDTFTVGKSLNPNYLDLANWLLFAAHEPAHLIYLGMGDRSKKIKHFLAGLDEETGLVISNTNESIEEIAADAIAVSVVARCLRKMGIPNPEAYAVMAKLLESLKNIHNEPQDIKTYGGVYSSADYWLWNQLFTKNHLYLKNGKFHSVDFESINKMTENISSRYAINYFNPELSEQELGEKITSFSERQGKISTRVQVRLFSEIPNLIPISNLQSL